MNKKNATSFEKKAALENIRNQFNAQDSHTQRARLLAALQRFAVTTYEAMRYLDIYDPRPRVHELRHRDGHSIATHWQTVLTEAGEKHRVGLYVLQSGVKL